MKTVKEANEQAVISQGVRDIAHAIHWMICGSDTTMGLIEHIDNTHRDGCESIASALNNVANAIHDLAMAVDKK